MNPKLDAYLNKSLNIIGEGLYYGVHTVLPAMGAGALAGSALGTNIGIGKGMAQGALFGASMTLVESLRERINDEKKVDQKKAPYLMVALVLAEIGLIIYADAIIPPAVNQVALASFNAVGSLVPEVVSSRIALSPTYPSDTTAFKAFVVFDCALAPNHILPYVPSRLSQAYSSLTRCCRDFKERFSPAKAERRNPVAQAFSNVLGGKSSSEPATGQSLGSWVAESLTKPFGDKGKDKGKGKDKAEKADKAD